MWRACLKVDGVGWVAVTCQVLSFCSDVVKRFWLKIVDRVATICGWNHKQKVSFHIVSLIQGMDYLGNY